MRLLHTIQLARVQLARRTGTQRRIETLLHTPQPHPFNRRAIDFQGFGDRLIAQARTSHTFIRLEQNTGVRQCPSRCFAFGE